MQFVILSQDQVEEYVYEEPHVNISIHSPREAEAKLSELATGRKASLFLEFHDCDDVTLNGAKISDITGTKALGTIQCITPEHAKQILDFFNTWKDKVDLVVVNCLAGISRSSGTAAALTVVSGGSDEWIFKSKKYHPNMLVYRTILNEAFGYGKEDSKSS
jgi:predicted protein tyrosine phosphatase